MNHRFWKNAAMPFGRPKVTRPQVIVQPNPPAGLKGIFASFKPPYQYSNGIHPAYFVKMVFWKQSGRFCGQWVGMYQTDMTGGGQFWTERYFWGFQAGSFIEIKQHDVRGPRKRMLRG